MVNLDKKSMDAIVNRCKRMPVIPSTLFDHPYFGTPVIKLDLRGWCMTALPERVGVLPSLVDVDLSRSHALAKNEGTYAILSKISTLTKLSLRGCDMESLPEGSP